MDGERIFVGVLQDITERKRIEGMKDSFISTVNHELRTPLTSILGGVELLDRLYAEHFPEKARDLLKITESNTRRIIRIVNDILDIQKMEAGEMEFSLKMVNLSSLIKAAVDENKIYAEKYQAEAIVEELPETILISADADRLIQVMTNLLSNAIKFSPDGGVVRVTTELDQTRNLVRVNVIDQGPGIPEDFKDKLFKRFTQADSSLTRKGSGTGLGLSISKNIIEEHGGKIGVESEEGKGAIFYFELTIHENS